eukprot:TRINITY_DN10735_c0_g1_i3.p1 TRINITY_DN10735_c0_g1~~TRINITY_DN10735_c0_g1_i3.p1  ORF type:complete len:190 (+),score=24.00 TRINITY_DN10735_c0_g1_i3:105-674(+)
MGLQHEDTVRELEAAKVLVSDTARKTQDIINMVNLDSQLLTDTKGIMMSRISKIEDDVLALTTRGMPKTSPKYSQAESKNMVNLRIDAVRSEIDTEVLPKINELQLKMKAVELQLSVIETQGIPANNSSQPPPSILLTKLNEKGIAGISEMVKTGMDSMGKEVKGYKMFLDSLRAVSYTHLTLPTICSV